ncbi:MAG: tRNA pseudouridine(54/55) synthase Pus10 [Thermoplasmatales archaeon B_DKE]|nr:MAG: tRNA pseudouridine(54/55) synthase Pus10 [Thermoplasmatales archaeon B_DKE]QRF75720.1 tRNA pseudouridine synthase Pus10 [Thermoplasmatales archaeon]
MKDLSRLLQQGLCTRCIGRVFASIDTGLTNHERGRMILFSIKAETGMPVQENEEKKCPVCHGIFTEFEKYYEIVNSELSGYEYRTILIGSRFPANIMEMEAGIQEEYGSLGESIKKEFNREFGKFFTAITGREAEFETPDINILVDTEYDSVNIQARSVYIRGTYMKFRRDLPQTRWIHDSDMHESVESIIGEPLKEMTRSHNYYLHAAGREDVDVRMLGNGREFVIEAYSPSIRQIDLVNLRDRINNQNLGVTVSDLTLTDSTSVKKVKMEMHYKTYRVIVECENELDPAKLENTKKYLSGRVIYQRTPIRVMRRRADIIRERKIETVDLLDISGKRATLEITAESGTYIKELINGDGGRTDPSMSSIYGNNLRVSELDVVNIHRSEK